MASQPNKYTLSVEDYSKMSKTGILQEKDRVELINGEIWSMSPIGYQHGWWINLLIQYFPANFGKKYQYWSQSPVLLGEYSMPEPDFALLNANFQGGRYPTLDDIVLIVEIADTSLRFDQTVKSTLYAQAGIPEYWIVNLQEERMEVYHHPEQASYQTQQFFALKAPFFSPSLNTEVQFPISS